MAVYISCQIVFLKHDFSLNYNFFFLSVKSFFDFTILIEYIFLLCVITTVFLLFENFISTADF